MLPHACVDVKRPVATCPGSTSVRHRSPPSLTPWKTQCAQSVQSWLDACPWNVKASTELGSGVVQALVPVQENVVPHPGSGNGSLRVAQYLSWCCGNLPPMMGLLRVEGIGAPEVKFLDRCKTNCSEGVLQEHVRRSRMRARGAKMIRHHRSPTL